MKWVVETKHSEHIFDTLEDMLTWIWEQLNW